MLEDAGSMSAEDCKNVKQIVQTRVKGLHDLERDGPASPKEIHALHIFGDYSLRQSRHTPETVYYLHEPTKKAVNPADDVEYNSQFYSCSLLPMKSKMTNNSGKHLLRFEVDLPEFLGWLSFQGLSKDYLTNSGYIVLDFQNDE